MPMIEVRVFHGEDAEVTTLEAPTYGTLSAMLSSFAAGFDAALVDDEDEEPSEDDPSEREIARFDYPACETHCCPRHGCKYSYKECPVESRLIAPRYTANNGCEWCANEAISKAAD